MGRTCALGMQAQGQRQTVRFARRTPVALQACVEHRLLEQDGLRLRRRPETSGDVRRRNSRSQCDCPCECASNSINWLRRFASGRTCMIRTKQWMAALVFAVGVFSGGVDAFAGSCSSDADCAGYGKCSSGGQCGACGADSDCNGYGRCSSGTCGVCSSSSECANGTCMNGRCGACGSDSDCRGNGRCSGGKCGSCGSSSDCMIGLCSSGACGACGADSDCKGGSCSSGRCSNAFSTGAGIWPGAMVRSTAPGPMACASARK